MSRHTAYPADEPSQESSQSHTNPLSNPPGQSLPPFQPFPARNCVAPSGSSGFAPQSGLWDAEVELCSSSGAMAVPYHPQTRASLTAQISRQDTGGSTPSQERHPSTLPAFTPFPAAAPSSRYAPPPDSRAELTRPVLPPIFNPEGVSSSPWASEHPTNL
ncbi:hypothetical protein FRC11_008713, partial [Ceratobasidium sp. 423]